MILIDQIQELYLQGQDELQMSMLQEVVLTDKPETNKNSSIRNSNSNQSQ